VSSTVADPPSLEGAPRWLLRAEPGLCPCGCIGKRRKGHFVEKTIEGGSGILQQAIFSDDLALRRGFLQRLDPRVKLLTMVMLLVTAAFVRNIEVLIVMYLATLVLAAVSKIPVGFFVKRVWFFIPIFTGIIVLPATFSFITPGNVVVPLWSWHGNPVGITSQGLEAAALIVSRVAVSISLVVLVTITTPWNRLLAGMRGLLVPRVFILVFGMAYRYLFLLLNSVQDMYMARKARSVAAERGDVKEGQRFVSASIGALFGKAHQLSEEVHMAMLSRGYQGDARTLGGLRVRAIDVAWVAGCAVVGLLVLGGDRFLGR
jgi:cobalt ECF transporter T component CbiQ